jgi:hypothetical protein
VTVSFYSTRVPVWGDFYAKDGRDKSAGEDSPVAAWNAGFGVTDVDPTAPASSGSIDHHVLVPDSMLAIPEPASIAVVLAGGVGVIVRRRRR